MRPVELLSERQVVGSPSRQPSDLKGTKLSDAVSVASAAVASAALLVAYLTYRSQRGKRGLEYLVVSRIPVIPWPEATDLSVTHNGTLVPDATVVIVRIVNTGDKAVLEEDFRSDLVIRFKGTLQVMSARVTNARPPDLHAKVSADGDSVSVQPLLINSTDMMQVQALLSGAPETVTVEGRIANTRLSHRRELPYSPGSGREGELDNAFEWGMWYVAPAVVVAIVMWPLIGSTANALTKVAAGVAAALFVFVLNPMYVRYLIRRRRMWAP